MKDKVFIVFALLLFSIPSFLFGQKGEMEGVSEKLVTYLVIKGDKLKNVATRFMVSPHDIMRANNIRSKNFTVYPGMIIRIPLKVRPKVWDPTKDDLGDTGQMLTEDRRPSADYEVLADGFDFDIKEDFVTIEEAKDDSIQFEKVGTHMSRIDKRINYLTFRIDSFKQVEFNFEYNEHDLNSVLGRMKLARDKYYLNGPLGKEIDSLNSIKAKLANLRIRLRNRITEYEYLKDNAAYARENYERDEKNKDTHWGDQITYESNYARSKARHDQLLVNADTATRPHNDTDKAQSKPLVKDTAQPNTKPVAIKTDNVAPPAKAIDTTTVSSIPIASPLSSVKHQKVDFSILQAKTTPIEIKSKQKSPPELYTILPTKETMNAITVVQTKESESISTKDASAPPPLKTTPVLTNNSTKGIDTTRHTAILTVSKDTIKKSDQKIITVRTTDTIAKPQVTRKIKDTVPDTKTVGMQHFDTISKHATVAVPGDTSVRISAKTVINKTADTIAKSVMTEIEKKNSTISNRSIDTASKVVTTTITKDSTAKSDHKFATTRSAETLAKPAVAAIGKDTTKKASAVTTTTTVDKIKTNAQIDNTIIAVRDDAMKVPAEKAAKSKTKDPAPKADKTPALKKEKEAKPVTAQKVDELNNNISAQTKTNHPDAEPVLTRVQVHPVILSFLTMSIPVNEKVQIPFADKNDSSLLFRPVRINQDPLASYKTDSNFVMTNVQLKEVPVVEYKNKPKYLMPVDSISRIKGEFYLIRARQVLEKGDFKEGDKFLRKSLELNPNNAATWMLHADLYLTIGAADKALKEYAISGEIDSTNPKVFYNIALLYAKANDEQKAYKYFSKATDVNEKYLLAYMGRASVLMDQRDYEGAILDYDKALVINKYYSPAYKGRALAKMEARKFNEAVIDFNYYLEIEDPDGYVLYQRGIAKILSNNLLQGCLDLSSSKELGFKDAEKAIKKFCE